jgi:3-hydroxybutyryl-CoA dehydrogenase
MVKQSIQRVCILGAGVMGHGIALVTASAGYETTLYDITSTALQKAREQIESFTKKSVEMGKLTEGERQNLLAKLRFTSQWDQIADHQLYIEAIIEEVGAKKELFQKLEQIAPSDAMIASNTSSIPITLLGSALEKPQRFLGLHFFNPAPLMKLVEVIKGVETHEDVVEVAVHFVNTLPGKTPVLVKDIPGFIVNRIARFFYLESLRIVEQGIARHEDVDRLMEGIGFRMGPFRLMDLIGIDTNHAVTRSIYEGYFHESRFRPSLLQQKMVESGRWGRKTKKGFYSYPIDGPFGS